MIKYWKHSIALLMAFFMLMQQSFSQNTDEEVPDIAPPAIDKSYEDVESNAYFYDHRDYNDERISNLKKLKEFQYNKNEPAKLQYRNQTQQDIEEEREREKRSSGRGDGEHEKKERRSSEPKKQESNKSMDGNVNWLFIIILGLGLVFLIMYLLGFRPNNIFGKNKSASANPNENDVEENIHNIKFETELEKAIRNKNYKLAVRILYLESLKKLSDYSLIDWKKNKTNWDYVKEVQRANLQQPFKKITNAFDYVWYGNFQIDESTFKLMQEQIEDFKSKIEQN